MLTSRLTTLRSSIQLRIENKLFSWYLVSEFSCDRWQSLIWFLNDIIHRLLKMKTKNTFVTQQLTSCNLLKLFRFYVCFSNIWSNSALKATLRSRMKIIIHTMMFGSVWICFLHVVYNTRRRRLVVSFDDFTGTRRWVHVLKYAEQQEKSWKAGVKARVT